MARKLNEAERGKISLARASQIAVSDEWFDGEVWVLEPEDYAPVTPEVARQLIRTQATKKGHKIATKIREGLIYLQKVDPATMVVESDNDPDEDEAPEAEAPEAETSRRGRS